MPQNRARSGRELLIIWVKDYPQKNSATNQTQQLIQKQLDHNQQRYQ
jgi:hypothetical protein